MPKVGRDRVLGPLDRLLRSGSAVGLSDTQLLERFANRHDEAAEAAFAAIIERHGPMVLSICRRHLPCPEDANDAFQATFLILVRQAGTVRRRNSLASWLHGVAIRVSARSRAASARRGVVERQTAEQAAIAAAPPRDDLSEIWREVDRLPRSLHSAVMLCYFEGLSHEQAATRLGWPVGTVRSRLARARDQLRTRLARQGYDPASPLAGLPLIRPSVGSLPAALVEPTARAAMLVAVRDAFEAGLVSASVLSLTEGALHAMLFTKIKLTAAAVALGLLIASAGVYAYQTPGSSGEPAAQKAVDPARETISALKLEGEYRLSRVDDPMLEPVETVTKMRITAFDDRKFVVRGVGQDWVGEGEVADNQGYYHWKFDNGQTGRTDFAVQPDGSITGRVLGSGHDWRYLARPTRPNFKPATALEAVSDDPVAAKFIRQDEVAVPRTDTQARLDNIERKLEAVLDALKGKGQTSEPKAVRPSDEQDSGSPDRVKRGESPR